jgi:hypothetical protein
MAIREDQPLDEVTLFLDGNELYATGDPSDVDRVLRDLKFAG